MEFLRALGRPILGFLIAAAIFGVIERIARAKDHRPAWRRPGFGTDAAWWMVTPLVTKTITKVGVGLAVFVIAWATIGHSVSKEAVVAFVERPTWASRLPWSLEIFVTLATADFVGYWEHRLFHRGWLWRTHAVHHSSERLDWLAAVRVHPLNELLSGIVRVAVLVGLGFRPTMLAGVVPFLTFYAVLLHANVPWSFGWLGKIIASPRFHRHHHALEARGAHGVNFAGFFACFDLLFGTYHLPEGDEMPATGIREPIPPTVWGQLMFPFRRRT